MTPIESKPVLLGLGQRYWCPVLRGSPVRLKIETRGKKSSIRLPSWSNADCRLVAELKPATATSRPRFPCGSHERSSHGEHRPATLLALALPD
nr:unnamed protein product [Digitaria exilis]